MRFRVCKRILKYLHRGLRTLPFDCTQAEAAWLCAVPLGTSCKLKTLRDLCVEKKTRSQNLRNLW